MLLGELLKHAHDLIDDPHTNIPERLYEDLTGDAYYQLLLKREEPVEEALLMQYKDYLNRYLKGEPYQYIIGKNISMVESLMSIQVFSYLAMKQKNL